MKKELILLLIFALVGCASSDNYQIIYTISLGYPKEKPKAKPRDKSKIRIIENNLFQ